MKVMVIGSHGFVGRALLDRLRPTEFVFSLATSSQDFQPLDRHPAWLAETLIGIDTVFLCAGRTGGVGRMARDPLSFVYPNVRIHMNVFEACVAAGVRRLVCAQSTTGYPDSPNPMHEDDYLAGELHSAYTIPGNAHRFIYRLAAMHPKLEVVFFRPSNVYGPGNSFDPQNSHVIEATVRKVVERRDPFVIWGNGLEVRDATYITDFADAMARGLDCPPGAYNVAGGEEMNVNEIVRELMDCADFHPVVEHDLTKPTAIPARRIDITKIRSLGWRPKVSMREGLRLTLNWYAAQCEPVT